MMMVTTAPGIPKGFRNERCIAGNLKRNRMNESACKM
jgi:hypothetical protein